MVSPRGILFFDIAIIFFMLVLAYLSNRLGEALKIKPYYKILYLTSIMIILAASIDALTEITVFSFLIKPAVFIRFLAGAIALVIVLRYWGWIFFEFFKNRD